MAAEQPLRQILSASSSRQRELKQRACSSIHKIITPLQHSKLYLYYHTGWRRHCGKYGVSSKQHLTSAVQTGIFQAFPAAAIPHRRENEKMTMKNNQQPRPKATGYVVLIRYLYSGFNTYYNRHKSRTRKRAEGIKPLNMNKGAFNKINKLSSCGYFFTHQFTDNSFGRGMVSRSFNTQPIGGKVIDKNERTAFFRAFCKKTAFAIT
jgi:hypothetical protein